MQSFHDERLPIALGLSASGGSERRNEIVALTSGVEVRNMRHAHGRRRFDIGTGLRDLGDLRRLVAFFEARRGSLHAFRFRDPLDHSSAPDGGVPHASDQPLGIGDGETRRFGLLKLYGTGSDAYRRPIALPETASIVVSADHRTRFGGWHFDASQAEIVFDEAPRSGEALRCGFLFDIAVRFDMERIDVNLAGFQAGEATSVPLIEVLP